MGQGVARHGHRNGYIEAWAVRDLEVQTGAVHACGCEVVPHKPHSIALGGMGLIPSTSKAFICGWAVECRHPSFVQAKVDGELSAVMCKMAEDGIAKHHVSRAFTGEKAVCHQLP